MIGQIEAPDIPRKISKADIEAKIKSIVYSRHENTTLTMCYITMENGAVIPGSSACIDPKNFSEEMGKQIAYDNAFEQLWALEDYLLRDRLYKAGVVL